MKIIADSGATQCTWFRTNTAGITEQASAYDDLQRMSTHDILTGINREDARVHEVVRATTPGMEQRVETTGVDDAQARALLLQYGSVKRAIEALHDTK